MTYQTFGEEKGDSDSYGKLKAIKLPDLHGKRFLDVGCNAGFFCGAALESGASEVVGLDANASAIQSARANFPKVIFHQNGWETLPDGQFDVIILLSALHYAEDQAALIQSLMSKVDKEGLLILEVGIAAGDGERWVQTERAIDSRIFPTMEMMQRVLDRYTYRLIGPSVAQAGDPNPRYVFHVWNRKPVLIACLGESGVGKSDMARLMKSRSNGAVKVLHLDDLIPEFSQTHGLRVNESSAMHPIGDHFADLSDLYLQVSKQGLLTEMADMVVDNLQSVPLSLIEGGIPSGYRTHFLNEIGRKLDSDIWTLSPLRVRAIATVEASATSNPNWVQKLHTYNGNPNIIGFVDQLQLTDTGLNIVGWGFDKLNREPIDGVHIMHEGLSFDIMQISRRRRPDVKDQVGGDTDLLGFAVEMPFDKDSLLKPTDMENLGSLGICLWASGELSGPIQSKPVVLQM